MSKFNWGKRAYAVCLLCATTAVTLPAQTFTTLHSFDNTDGLRADAALVQGTDGNLYGTTNEGGANGGGTVFKITASGTLTTLYSFCSQTSCTDGAYPVAALVQAADGNFYGTTAGGGANGQGTVFKITHNGTLTTLYNFCSQSGCMDGEEPTAALVQATNGNFYGTTQSGGVINSTCPFGCGTVFKITHSGMLTTLYSFCSQNPCADGAYPTTALVQATDGNFYGTTYEVANGYGTVFEIAPGGKLTTLHSFDGTDGGGPVGLVQATDGNFYGTTEALGPNGLGTVFKMIPSGELTTLYSFCSQSACADGALPYAGLVQATDENFYGTTQYGGATNNPCPNESVPGCGTIFKISASGTLTTLYSFCSQSGCADGRISSAGLVQDTNGTFYGTTQSGGASYDGTIFSLSVGLGPFVETQPTSGRVLERVEILGTDLTGASRVTFNGTPTFFVVASSSLVTAWVPLFATSGEVKVRTPHGTLSSNVPFRVKQ